MALPTPQTVRGEFPAQITRTMENKREQKFCLQWKDHESNMRTGFKEIRNEKDFFDVTLACEDNKQLQAHKVILGACSPFFRTVLKRNPHPNPLIYLKGVKYDELDAVVNFMYQGEVNVAQDDLNAFLAVAEDLQVKGLTQQQQQQQPGQRVQHSSPIKPTTPYKQQQQAGDRQAMPGTPRHDSEEEPGYDRYIDPYLPLALKTESPVVDVESDSDIMPVATHDPGSQDRYEYQQGYHKMNTSYQEHTGDSNHGNNLLHLDLIDFDMFLDLYSQHTTKATHGEYICNLCGKQARDMYAMKKHLEGKHEITPGYNCPTCHIFCKTKSILFKHKKNFH